MSDEKKIPAEAPATEETAAAELTEEQLGEVAGGDGYPTQGHGMDTAALDKVRRGW